MATPARKLILDNIKTVLASVSTATGFKTNIKTVERVVRDWADVARGIRPWVGFSPRLETFAFLPGKQIRATLPVVIVACVSGDSVDDKHAKLNDLHDDIIAALGADPTRGACAIDTIIRNAEDDIGDPDTADTQGFTGTLVINAEVHYMRTYAST